MFTKGEPNNNNNNKNNHLIIVFVLILAATHVQFQHMCDACLTSNEVNTQNSYSNTAIKFNGGRIISVTNILLIIIFSHKGSLSSSFWPTALGGHGQKSI